MDEKKHGLYKVTDQADRMARLVMDQLAKDGCANLENIRNALMAPLVTIEQDHQDEFIALSRVKRPVSDVEPTLHGKAPDLIDLRTTPGGDHMENRGGMHVKCRCPKCSELAERGKSWRDEFDIWAHKVAARHAGKSDAADAMRYAMSVDPAKPEASIQLWGAAYGPNGPEYRFSVKPTRQLLQALGNAIATQKPQRVSINDGTYVMPDGEVLTELEMIKRSGTDGRGKRD